MPRLSLWRPNKGNDYKFFDRRISEMMTIGGTDINVHKYLGPINQAVSFATSAAQVSAGPILDFANTATITLGQFVSGTGIIPNTTVIAKTATTVTLSASTTVAVPIGTPVSFYTDPTQAPNTNGSVTSIQDLLFLENRDRKYDTDIYTLRGIYRINDNDFDLSQFGLFLTGDTLFMVFHLNDMVDTIGRKLMVGDVIELPHLKDYYPLDDDLPTALKRYYVINDATRAAEGFAPTWYPHLWRVKVQPLVDSQEYKDILNNIKAGDDTTNTLADVLSTYNKYLDINNAIIQRAEAEVPASGYDTTFIYTEPVTATGMPGDPDGLDASAITEDASEAVTDATSATMTPSAKVQGYLTSDALPPNGTSVAAGITFPTDALEGDYFLRLDYVPNRLFRHDGARWVKIEDAVRTNLTPGPDNKTQRNSFTNNPNARMAGALAWDAIRVADPYTPIANAATASFTLSSKSVVTKVPYVATYGVRTILNSTTITNTVANVGGNIGFTLTTTLSTNDVLEYTVYSNVTPERVALSDALRPLADN